METVEVDQRDLTRLVAVLMNESDGKELRRDLVAELRAVAEPFAMQARGAIIAMDSQNKSSPSLRAAIAAAVDVEVRTGGLTAGVFVVARKRGMPRRFRNAPKHTNARKGWRRQVFGSDVWEHQMGEPGWFDDTMAAADAPAERGAKKAMDNIAQRIEQRTKK